VKAEDGGGKNVEFRTENVEYRTQNTGHRTQMTEDGGQSSVSHPFAVRHTLRERETDDRGRRTDARCSIYKD